MSKILIVDDDLDFQRICRTILEAEGYDVLAAGNGEAALELMRVESPDLVLLSMCQKVRFTFKPRPR